MDEPKVIRVKYQEDEAYFLEAFDRMPKDVEAVRKATKSYAIALLVSLLLMALMSFLDYQRGDKRWWLPFVIFGGIFWIVWFKTLRRSARRSAFLKQMKQQLAPLPGESWAAFSESGFLSTGGNGRSSHYPWQSILKVETVESGLYVFIDPNTLFWFPKRIFHTPEDYNGVLEFIKQSGSNLVLAANS